MSSIKNVYQFRTTSKITQAQGAASTFTIGNDVFTNSSVTITGGSVKLENRTGSQVELMTITATGGTATIATRGILPDGTTSTSYQYERPRNTLCTVTVLENQIIDKTASEAVLFSAKVYADTTERDAALGGDGVATKNYTNVKTTADGLFWRYNTTTNVWEAIDTGTTTPNASTTAAGKVEKATDAQIAAGTATGETGAPLFASPDDLAQQIQSNSYLYAEDAGANDTYVVTYVPAITALTEGMILSFYANTANTGACTLNVNGLGAKNIITKDGNNPQSGVIRLGGRFQVQYDGTSFVLLQEDFATTSVKGVVEMATDAEYQAGSDETRYVNPKQAKLLVNVVTGSRNSSGTESIAHGLSKTPVMVFSYYNTTGTVIGNGFYGDGQQTSQYIVASGQAASTTQLISTTGGNDCVVNSIDATNLNVTWTDNGDGTQYRLIFIA